MKNEIMDHKISFSQGDKMTSLIYIPATATMPAYTFCPSHLHLFFCTTTNCSNEVDYNGDMCHSCLNMPALETYCPDCNTYSVLDDDECCDCVSVLNTAFFLEECYRCGEDVNETSLCDMCYEDLHSGRPER